MSQKTYRVTTASLIKKTKSVPTNTVKAFNKRVSIAMKEIDRDFQKKQRVSLDKAARIVLNA